jgi:hypothetical protein
MPARTVRHIVAITNGQGEESHLKITLELELNINLNANGLQATVTAKDVTAEETKATDAPKDDDGFGGFIVPTFESAEQIGFGKKVNAEQARTVEETFLKHKNRKKEEI